MQKMLTKIKGFLVDNWPILVILLVAIFLRFFKLGSVPPGLHPDEAANGLDIISMIEKGNLKVIYDTNGPREALFFYMQGIFVWLGQLTHIKALFYTPLSLRIAPAIIGVLTVWGTYLFGKELKSKNVGLFAAAAMAASTWHVQFSRNGFRAIMAPFALVFMFYYFLKAYRNKKVSDFVMTGVFFAVGFYTYLSFRMSPLIFIALIIYILVANRKFFVENLKPILLMSGIFLLLMIPMFIHFYHVPADILGRSSTSIFNPELNGGSAVKTLGTNIYKTMTMFNFHGDTNFRHNVAGLPMLDIVSGILFWIGLIICLFGILKIENFLLVMWFGAMSLPEVLTAEGIPHALRMVGTMPVVFIWIGMGAAFLFERFKSQKVIYISLFALLAFSGATTINRYFIKMPSMPEAGEAYAEDMVGIANDLNAYGQGRQNVLIVGEYGTKTIQFITNSTKPTWERYELYTLKDLKLRPGAAIYIQKDWINEATVRLRSVGYGGTFVPVPSKIDGRPIYYIAKER
jgi:hypothetical protein